MANPFKDLKKFLVIHMDINEIMDTSSIIHDLWISTWIYKQGFQRMDIL